MSRSDQRHHPMIVSTFHKLKNLLLETLHDMLRQSSTFIKRHRSTFARLNNADPSTVLYTIIGTNVAVYGMWQYARNDRRWFKFMANNFTLSTHSVIVNQNYHTLVTAMFSHRDGWHLAANMFGLYFFGQQSILLLGASRFLQLYLGGGLASALCHVFWPILTPSSWPARYRLSRYTLGLGASGAVSSLVAYSIFTNPFQIFYLYFIIPIPAAILGAGLVLNDLYGLYTGSSGMGNAAHLGGAAFGSFYFYYLRKILRTRF